MLVKPLMPTHIDFLIGDDGFHLYLKAVKSSIETHDQFVRVQRDPDCKFKDAPMQTATLITDIVNVGLADCVPAMSGQKMAASILLCLYLVSVHDLKGAQGALEAAKAIKPQSDQERVIFMESLGLVRFLIDDLDKALSRYRGPCL